MDSKLTYRKLCLATNYIYNGKATFIATNMDRGFPTSIAGRVLPAAGSIIESIKAVVGMEPVLIGKPMENIFQCLLKEQFPGEKPDLKKFLMIGDSLLTDIKFANNCGIDSLLVLSGNTNEVKAKQIVLEKKVGKDDGVPTYVAPYFNYLG